MLKKYFPFLRWFPMAPVALRSDVLAGLTVALVLIPQSMAYAELAGLPPWIGLYAALLPVILGGLWGSSNHLQTGPGATLSLLTASVLGPLAVAGSAEYVGLAGSLIFMVGLLWLALALLRLTYIINFLSRPVIEGFIHAGAIIIVTSQLGRILGVEMVQGGSCYLYDVAGMFSHLDTINGLSLAIGGVAVAVLILGRKWFPRAPVALIVVVAASALVYCFGWSDPARVSRPVEIVGAIPSGLPKVVNPLPSARDFIRLLPGALVLAFVGFMETCSVARGIAARSRQKLNLRQETIGQSLAALGSAFSGGYTVNGSFSRSVLNFASGAKTGLSAVFTGLFILLFLAFGLTRYLHYVPKTVLAAIIVAAVVRMIHFKQLWHYMVVNKADGFAAFGCFFATLLFAPQLDRGIVFGASISILIHLYRMMRPHVALLGLHPDGSMRDADLHGLKIDPNLPAIRLDGRLFFANTAYFEEMVYLACERFPKARYLAVVFSGINEIDASGTDMLKEVCAQLKLGGVELLFVDVKTQVMHVIRLSGLDREVGETNIFPTFEKARKEVYARLPSDLTYTI